MRSSGTNFTLVLFGFLPLLAGLAACSGCASDSQKWKFASWDVRRAVGLKKDEKPAPVTPARLVATWTDTVLHKAGESPKRGFGGRIAFFERETDAPVRVEGQLVVYAFDETLRQSHDTRPTRVYVFPYEQFPLHESESKLGPTYSFWLPWDDVGGPQRNISLIARFQPKEGAIVLGEQTRHLLPGSLEPRSAVEIADANRQAALQGVRLAAFAHQAPEAAQAETRPIAAESSILSQQQRQQQMTTETIPLPKRLGETMQETAGGGVRDGRGAPISALATSTARSSGTTAAGESPAAAGAGGDEMLRSGTAARASVTEAGPAAPGSLRDSLLGTLPARGRQDARRGPGRAP